MSTTQAPSIDGTLNARAALARIGAAGGTIGLGFGDQPNVLQVYELLPIMERLGIDAPAGLAAGLEPLAELHERIQALAPAGQPPALDPHDADLEERFAQVCNAQLVGEVARPHITRLHDGLRADRKAVIASHMPALHEALNAFYVANVREFHHHDDEGLTGAERDRRGTLWRDLSAAVAWLWERSPRAHDDNADIVERALWFEWTPQAWANLDPFASFLNPYDQALKAGATPRLARSRKEARDAIVALQPNHRRIG